ncbi:hypothetical protein ACN429_06625 [Pseudomonas oryzihabitans]|uniref:hypothetical protein n=1 Tax=Pseudomonas oryzihabitans TaxID=47885 RepID=UPI0036445C3F
MDILRALNILVLCTYLSILIGGGGMLLFMFFRKKKALHLLRESILKKISQGIHLSAADVIIMAKGVGLQRPSVNRTIYQLLHDNSEPKIYQEVKELSVQLDKEEPFNEFPEEVKPSLIRLSEICDQSQQKSDHFLLAPIQKTLASYVELKGDFEKAKKQTRLINAIGVVSFIIGAWGFYLTLKSPDIKDIEKAVTHALNAQSSTVQPLLEPKAGLSQGKQ